jgi:anterior pharynx defective protein 1
MGHGTAHAVFFGLSILAPAFGRATYYTQSCKQMPLFLVTGISIMIQLGLTTLLFLVNYILS